MTKKRKKGKANKDHIKDHRFKDRNVSPLESLPRAGKTLKSPFSRLQGFMVNRSWYDECIPNIIWACILSSFLERDTYLDLFRRLIADTREKIERRKEIFVTHNFLATTTSEEFDTMFSGVLANEEARRYLSALRLIDCLPDRMHWDRHLPEPDTEKDWQILAHAVGDTFDHQSQRATDIRWLKIAHYLFCQERLVIPPGKVEEFAYYPNKGDMRSVRPSIRALEIGTRTIEFGEEPTQKTGKGGTVSLPPRHDEAFWSEMKAKSGCIVSAEFQDPELGPAELRDEALSIMQEVDKHFHATIITTAPDPRHDGAFGLVLYSLTLLFNSAISYSHNLVEGRIILRSIMEAFVTLHYLSVKDDKKLWLQYRSYGSGQVKLAFLKNLREKDVPEFVDLALMEHLANEDMWMEFQDIELGNWADLNLRKMAEAGGIKNVYDKYYDWSSGYAHGQWICVRETVFVNCLNSLHRFHRIPAPPKSDMPSILPDACKLVNRMLDDLNHLYPSFKPRLKWHNKAKNDPPKGQLAVRADKATDQ